MTGSPIEDYLDDLLRRSRSDPRGTRRMLDETADHLNTAADEFVAQGMSRGDAEREAIRRFGPADPLVRAGRRASFGALVRETLQAAVLLGSCGLIAIGVSGGVAGVMNLIFGRRFVGGPTVFGTGGATVGETASDAVMLRVLAGLAGAIVLAGYVLARRRLPGPRVLPAGLVDALGAAAFAAGAVLLAAASVDQAVRGQGSSGVGFFLSGALVAAAATVVFCARAARALLRPALS